MIGALMGDIIGSPYEFDRGDKTKEFPLFSRLSEFTDDSVMMIAVAEALLYSRGDSDDDIKKTLVSSMREWGKRYPDAGYGGMFYRWLREKDPKPYGSFGNGSAMRVSSAGWLFETLEETRHVAALTAEVTHNHPEGIKGAEAVASAIFLARSGKSKQEIRDYIIREFGYDLSRTCDEIRPGYYHVETCQQTVPEAITAFLEGQGFEDVIRTAVSLGGDCDTLTCIAGSIAEAFYGVPEDLAAECRSRLPKDMLDVLRRFNKRRLGYNIPEIPITEELLEDGSFLKKAVEICNLNHTRLNLFKLLMILRDSWIWVPCTVVLSDADQEAWSKVIMEAAEKDELDSLVGQVMTNQDSIRMIPDILRNGDDFFFPVFTSEEEMGDYHEGFSAVPCHFLKAVELARNNEKTVKGIVINAFSGPFVVPVKLFDVIARLKSSVESNPS